MSISNPARTLTVTSAALPLIHGIPVLEPVRLSGREGMNSLFAYELLLKTPEATDAPNPFDTPPGEAADLDLDAFIGREISCVIQLDGMGAFIPGAAGASTHAIGAGERQINALITEAAFVGEEGRHLLYRLTLRPWLHHATLRSDCRIFQNQSVVQILDTVLGAYAFPVARRLIETYPERDYQTQFNESDFDFISRLCQEWGISYHFEHREGTHRLVLTDAMGAYQPNPSEAYRAVDYHPPGWKTDAEYLHGFIPLSRLTSGAYATREHDYTRPRADLHIERRDPRPDGRGNGQGNDPDTSRSAGQPISRPLDEVYAWHADPGGSHYAQPRAGRTGGPGTATATGTATAGSPANDPQAEGRLLAGLRMQALRTAGARAQARGNLRGMEPGCTFRLQNHPRHSANADYLILATRFLIEDIAQDSQIKDAAPGRRQQWRVDLELTAHPLTEALRPALTQRKPVGAGPQSAVVVGPRTQEDRASNEAGDTGRVTRVTGATRTEGTKQTDPDIWTDALGRIKVQFPWDREGRLDQNSSCWVRVSSPWAGNQLGGIQLPRIGQEVIVDFIGGDPDLPICTGRVHNALNQPPWELPGQAALSGFRSRELAPGGGNAAAGRSNHLVLDDTAGKIQAQLKSDHQASSLSLGAIARVAGHAGRRAEAGEGAELRTDGHVVIRGEQGALLTTEKADAGGPMKAMDETVNRLARARDRQAQGADAAMRARAQAMGDQDRVAEALGVQGEEIRGGGEGAGTGAGARVGAHEPGDQRRHNPDRFPELSAPHLVLTSPAGIASTTAGSTHIASDGHAAITSGGHTSISSGDSLLAVAVKAVRLFAEQNGIQLKTAKLDIDIEALNAGVHLLAKKDILMQAEAIHIEATRELRISGGGSYSVWRADGIEEGTAGSYTNHAASQGFGGPEGQPVKALIFPTAHTTQPLPPEDGGLHFSM